MQKYNTINWNVNPSPVPNSFNQGFSQYETQNALIDLTNQLIQSLNLGADEITTLSNLINSNTDDLNNKKLSISDFLTRMINNYKLDANGNFTGTLNGKPIVESVTGLESTVAYLDSNFPNKANQSDVTMLQNSKLDKVLYEYKIAFDNKVQSYLRQSMLGQALIFSLSILGDSVTNGEGANNEGEQYATMVKNAINSFQSNNGANYEVISNFRYKLSSTDITYGGTYGFNEDFPNGDCESITLQVGATITFTRDINNIILWFNRSNSSGSVEIYKDGVLFQTISLAGTDSKHTWTASNALRGGSHAYIIKCINAPVTITGLGTLKNSDQTNLIPFHRLGYSGKTLYEFQQGVGASDFINRVGKYGSNPMVLIIALGINDIFNSSCTVQQYIDRLDTLLKRVNISGNFVYAWVPYIPNPTTHPVNGGLNFQDFRTAIYQTCMNNNCGIIDLSTIDFVGNGFLSADGLHPNVGGHRAIATTILNSLGIVQNPKLKLYRYTLQVTDITSGGANGSKFLILGSLPNDARIVNMYIRNKNTGFITDYREVADYTNGYGLTLNKGLTAEPRWVIYKYLNGAVKIFTNSPTSTSLSNVDADNEIWIDYLF